MSIVGIPLDKRSFGPNDSFRSFEAFTDPMNSTFWKDFFVFLERVPPVITAIADPTADFYLVVDASRKNNLGVWEIALRTHDDFDSR